jgi:hypothetical protein
VGGFESSETFGEVVLLAGTAVVDGAAVVDIDATVVVDGITVAVGAATVVVDAAGKVVVDVDSCCGSSRSSISSSKCSFSEELEPPHADTTKHKQSKTAR